ncbi:hypothetical protein [Amycolatopsis thermophila]|uniref:Uncharacterized protein n=1 Tax=Amycolatopsis thermophila TaxID=206084 RepID=A0ABU0EPZ4_9PSEU|nr:hypothetical protein [Amycolatopsis thermophila]MDQ0377123.1 hypothetical protein [Amycolatopsis thermophila]
MTETMHAPRATESTSNDGVTTSIHLRRAGMSQHAISSRCRPGGPWRRLLPGVILLSNREPSRDQQLRAAVYHAGDGAVVTGTDALQAQGIPLSPARRVHVLIPVERRMASHEFTWLERTSRVPDPVEVDGIPFAPPARATIDIARHERDPDRLRRLLTLPVYYGLCSAEQLRAELDAGNQRGTSAVRQTLRSLGSLRETYQQGVARELLGGVPLPPPVWNVTICDSQGTRLGVVDAWWDEVALAWILDPWAGRSDQPVVNHLPLTGAGVTVVRTMPNRLRGDAHAVSRELTSAFATAARRRRPKVQALAEVAA